MPTMSKIQDIISETADNKKGQGRYRASEEDENDVCKAVHFLLDTAWYVCLGLRRGT
jgi:hypothetical protein